MSLGPACVWGTRGIRAERRRQRKLEQEEANVQEHRHQQEGLGTEAVASRMDQHQLEQEKPV